MSPSWEDLCELMVRSGYQRIHFVDVPCPQHGIFRCGLAESVEMYPCPKCLTPYKVVFMAEGLTRRPLPLQPQLVDTPMPRELLRALLRQERVPGRRRPTDSPIDRSFAAKKRFAAWRKVKAARNQDSHESSQASA